MNVLIIVFKIFLKGYICGLVYGDVYMYLVEILYFDNFYWFFNFNLDFWLI